MALNYPSCYYHPDRVATTTCTQCQKPICLEDNRKLSKRVNSNSGILCPDCYTNPTKIAGSINPLKIIIPLIVFIGLYLGGLFYVINSTDSENFATNFFALFIFFMIGITLFTSYVTRSVSKVNKKNYSASGSQNLNNPTTTSYSVLEKMKRQQDLNFNTRLPAQPQLVDLYCTLCGSKISPDQKFCPNCGARTK